MIFSIYISCPAKLAKVRCTRPGVSDRQVLNSPWVRFGCLALAQGPTWSCVGVARKYWRATIRGQFSKCETLSHWLSIYSEPVNCLLVFLHLRFGCSSSWDDQDDMSIFKNEQEKACKDSISRVAMPSTLVKAVVFIDTAYRLKI